jgi:hypothetical protein
MNFKGVQTYLEKSDKFSKIPHSHDILEYEFILTHLYSNIESSFTSGRRDLVYFMPKIAGHLSILLPLSQAHHCIYYFHYHKHTTVPNWARSVPN